MSRTKPIRLRHTKTGVVVRVIRLTRWASSSVGLAFRCVNETYGGDCYLRIEYVASGEWQEIMA